MINNTEALVRELTSVLADLQHTVHNSNQIKRKLYSQAQLAILDLEEYYLKANSDYDEKASALVHSLEKISSQLNLKPIRKRHALDDLCRFIFINSGLYFLGVYASLPFLLIKNIEHILHIKTTQSLSLYLRKWLMWIMLTSAGIVTETYGLDSNELSKLEKSDSVPILTFSHNSNLDGFLVRYVNGGVIL